MLNGLEINYVVICVHPVMLTGLEITYFLYFPTLTIIEIATFYIALLWCVTIYH